MSESRAIQASLEAGRLPSTVESLTQDFRALGVPSGGVLMVHAAMSKLGYVIGSAQAVVEALLAAIGPDGTLVMPTFAGDRGDPEPWQNPPVPEAWWPMFRSSMPAYDPRVTPTRMMGVVAETFRTWGGTLRSAHPSHSCAARGPQAEALVGEHPLANPMGEASPLARLYELDAQVLLLGVTHSNNSSLHLSEYRATGIVLEPITAGASLWVDGERRWVRYADVQSFGEDFEALGEAFALEPGAERCAEVGLARARLFSQRAVVDFGVEWLETHRRA
jgi:aminoglycoside 3-N-acetyltransferase